MSIHIKKKSKLYRVFQQSSLIDTLVFGFLIQDYETLLRLDKIIAYNLIGRLGKHLSNIYNSIKQVHRNVLNFHTNTNQNKPIMYRTPKGQIKVDIPISFSPQNLKIENGYSFSYSYMIDRKGKKQKFLWEAQFFITAEKSRKLWIYKERQCKSQLPVYTPDIIPIHKTDTLTVMIPFHASGQLMKDLVFYPLQLTPKPQLTCQIQKIYEWAPYDYYKNPIDFDMQQIVKSNSQLKLVKLSKSLIDKNYRIQMQCIDVLNWNYQNCEIRGEKQNKNINVYLKKKGSYIHRNNTVTLRVGDKLVIYLIRA